MSTPKRIFTLNIGSQTLSIAEFRPGRKKGTLRLHAFETQGLMADPAADATRSSQAALLLSEMVESVKAKKQTRAVDFTGAANIQPDGQSLGDERLGLDPDGNV